MPELEYDKGLDPEEVIRNRKEHGSNALDFQEERVFWHALRGSGYRTHVCIAARCMPRLFYCWVPAGRVHYAGIYPDRFGDIPLPGLPEQECGRIAEKMSASRVTVIRTGKKIIPVDDLVVDDLLLIEEGELVPADGLIVSSNDFLSTNPY